MLTRGEIVERYVPGTGRSQSELLEIVALDDDDDFWCGGAPNPQDLVLVRDEHGATFPLHQLWLAPEHLVP